MKKIKSILRTVLILSLTVCLCAVPVSAAEEGWKDAYRTVINQNTDEYGCVLQLADFDLDGTPELLIGSVPGSGMFSVIQHAFTFRDGAAVEVSVDDEYLKLGNSYELYRNDSTGQVHIEGKYVLRVDRGSSSDVTANYSLNGSVFSYVTTFVSSVDLGKSTYTVGSETVNAGQYNTAYNARNAGWTKIRFSNPNMTFTAKPSSAEIDSLLSSYESGFVLAVPSAHNIQVNGTPVSIGAYGIGGSNYFKLRDLAMLLNSTGSRFQVGYNNAANQITLVTGESYTATGSELAATGSLSQIGSPTDSVISVNGQNVDLTAYNIGGNNYFKLRDLGEALGFTVGWDDATHTVSISTAE